MVEGDKFDDVCDYVKMNSSENLFPLKMVERWGTTHNLLVAAAYGDIDAQRLIKAFESEDGYEKEKYNYDKVNFTTSPIYAFIKEMKVNSSKLFYIHVTLYIYLYRL